MVLLILYGVRWGILLRVPGLTECCTEERIPLLEEAASHWLEVFADSRGYLPGLVFIVPLPFPELIWVV
jgi:hypothetical protein